MRAPHKRAPTELGKQAHVPRERAKQFTSNTKGPLLVLAPATAPMEAIPDWYCGFSLFVQAFVSVGFLVGGVTWGGRPDTP